MRLELLPVLLGAVGALVGIALLADALIADAALMGRADAIGRERRRRARLRPHRGGEAAVALGLVALATALMGGDSWRFGTVAVLVGAVLLLLGAVLNGRYLRERLIFRGAERRQPERTPRPPDERPPSAPGPGDGSPGR